MANFSQPPYGMPYNTGAPPQPSPYPPTPHDPRGVAAESYQYNAALPGLNLHNFAQTPQPQYQQYWQPPYQAQNAYPPVPFPPPFMAQNGFPPPPPLPPQANRYYASTSQAPVQSPQVPTPAIDRPSDVAQQNQPFPDLSGLVSKPHGFLIPGSDKEDGELSERDRMSESPASIDVTQPVPRRSAPDGLDHYSITTQDRIPRSGTLLNHEGNTSIASSVPEIRHHNFAPPPTTKIDTTLEMPTESPTPHIGGFQITSLDNLPEKHDKAKNFIALMNANKVGYHQILNEGFDVQLLGTLYRELQLPIDIESTSPVPITDAPTINLVRETQKDAVLPTVLAPQKREPSTTSGEALQVKSNGVQDSKKIAPASNGQVLPGETAPLETRVRDTVSVKTNMPQQLPPKSGPSPVDRKDYIARLQAAKKGKQAVVNKITPPAKPLVVNTLPDTKIPQASSTPESAQKLPTSTETLSAGERARIKTELVRQRMEALKRSAATQALISRTNAIEQTKGIARASISRSSSSSSAVQTTEQDRESALPSRGISTKPMPEAVPQANSMPSFSAIPGLFMAASSPPVKSVPLPVTRGTPLKESLQPTSSSSRKRPVAWDFDDLGGSPPSTTFKRPLGQFSRDDADERMVIEVSDDETASCMDIDEDLDASKPTTLASVASDSATKQHTLRNLPPLSDFPSRSASVKPVTPVVSTPSGGQTPSHTTYTEDLKKREEEIAKMRRKIAEIERKKALVKAKEAEKGALELSASSPVPVAQLEISPSAGAPNKSQFATSSNSILPGLASSAPLITATAWPQTRPLQTEVSVSTPSGSPTDWKRLRRAEIKSGLPTLDANLASNTARLEQLRKEMEQLEADNRKRLQDKENLIKELESLGIDTEGMPHEELQAKKDEIVQRMENDASLQAEASSASNLETSNGVTSVSSYNELPELQSRRDAEASSNEAISKFESSIFQPVRQDQNASDEVSQASGEVMDMSDKESDVLESAVATVSKPIQLRDTQSTSATPMVESYEPAFKEKSSPEDDGEDFYSPEPVSNPPQETSTGQGEPHEVLGVLHRQPSKSPSEDEDIAMSTSTSSEQGDDYEPEELQPPYVNQSQKILPEHHEGIESSSTSSLTSSSADNDKSADAGEVFVSDVVQNDAEDPAHRSSGPGANVKLGANTLQYGDTHDQRGAEDDYEPLDLISQQPRRDGLGSTSQFRPESTENKSLLPFAENPPVADDLASELQPQFQSQEDASVGPTTVDDLTINDPNIFVPYESPLRMFKSFRYHPGYADEVAGGFRSMTFSHQIDPDNPICEVEAAGEICSDPHCANQHFRGMGISDDKLLVQLGTANPGKTSEEKQQWNDGLRVVLRQLRQQETKDPDIVAMEIANYRRRFLRDDTRVLNL